MRRFGESNPRTDLKLMRNEGTMGIQEEIFDEFYKKLEEDENFPKPIVIKLKKILKSGEAITRENLLDIIKTNRSSDANKN